MPVTSSASWLPEVEPAGHDSRHTLTSAYPAPRLVSARTGQFDAHHHSVVRLENDDVGEGGAAIGLLYRSPIDVDSAAAFGLWRRIGRMTTRFRVLTRGLA